MAAGKDIIGRVQKFTLQLLAIGIPLDKVILKYLDEIFPTNTYKHIIKAGGINTMASYPV